MMSPTRRIDSIDFIKGIGIIGIVVCHFGADYLSNSQLKILINNCARFVQLFLIITTFLCITSLQSIDIYSRHERLFWFKKRLIRLVPVYYLAIMCYVIIEINIPSSNSLWGIGSNSIGFVFNIITHLSFTNGFIPAYSNTLIRVGWYVAALPILYVILIVYYRHFRNITNTKMYIFSLIICFIAFFASFLFKEAESVAYFRRFSIWAQMPVIVLGIIVFHVNYRLSGLSVAQRKTLSSILKCISLSLLAGLLVVNIPSPIGQIAYGICFSFILISYLLYYKCHNWNRLFEIMGRHSYCIYLMHPLVIRFVKLMDLYILNGYFSYIINLLIAILISFVGAIFIHLIYEIPILRLISKK